MAKSRIATRRVHFSIRGDLEPTELKVPTRLTRGTDVRGEISVNSEVWVAPWISPYGARSAGEFVPIGSLSVDDAWVAAQIQFQAGRFVVGQLLQLLWYAAREEIRSMPKWALKPELPVEHQWRSGWGWQIHELEDTYAMFEGPNYRPDGPHVTGGVE